MQQDSSQDVRGAPCLFLLSVSCAAPNGSCPLSSRPKQSLFLFHCENVSAQGTGQPVCLRCVGATACERPGWNADTPDVSSGRPTETGSSRLDLRSDVKPCEASSAYLRARSVRDGACSLAPQICALSVCHSLAVVDGDPQLNVGSGSGKSVKQQCSYLNQAASKRSKQGSKWMQSAARDQGKVRQKNKK